MKARKIILSTLFVLGLATNMITPVMAENGTGIATPANADPVYDDLIEEEFELEADLDLDLLDELPDNDELFTGFFEQQLYDIPNGGVSRFGRFGESSLSGHDQVVYNKLKKEIVKIANGERSNTEIVITAGDLGIAGKKWTAAELGVGSLIDGSHISSEAIAALKETIAVAHEDVHSLLLINCPYELYWFDKTVDFEEIGGTFSICYGDNKIWIESKIESKEPQKAEDVVYNYKFTVAEGYRDSGQKYKTNASKITAAKTAATNAKAIVEKYQDKRDELKLEGYLKEICDLTSYNTDMLSGNHAFGDPWQVVYVFDDDLSNKVVCEGYAKAFQYLFDLSEFNHNISSYLVTGKLIENTTQNHMWNVVTMEDGKNYLVDVTNCDSGTIGAPDKLFLAGADGSVESGYAFSFGTPPAVTNVKYEYDADTKDLYGNSILELAASDYVPVSDQFEIKEPSAVPVYGGDPIQLETTGESGGAITWSSSNPDIASIDNATGIVTIHKAGTVTITAEEAAYAGYSGAHDSYKLVIAPRTLQAKNVEVTSKKYDGTTNAVVTGAIDNGMIRPGDEVTVLSTSGQFDSPYAGTNKNVMVEYTLTGEDAGNYTVAPVSAVGSITPAELTLVGATLDEKTYDGTSDGWVKELVVSGLAGTDILTLGVDYQASAEYSKVKVGTGIDVTVKAVMKDTDLGKSYILGNNEIIVQANIKPADLKIDVEDIVMKAGEKKPSYSAVISGLGEGDSLTDILFTDNAGVSDKKGTYTITASGAIVSGGNENYIISYYPGTLTITLPTELITNASDRAAEAKKNIQVSDLSASKVSKGTKFVNSDDEKALNDAVKNAEAVISNAVTLQDIQKAAAELEKAIETFKSSIKTGTKGSSGGGGGGGGGGSSSGGGGGSSSGGGGGGGGGSSSDSNKKPAQAAAAGVLVDTSSNKPGVWTNDAVGRWFRYSDGTWPAGKWLELSQNGQKHWYYFNTSGYLVTGWILDGGIWYYLNPAADAAQGQMSVGWQLINGVWYYLNPVSGQRPLGAMYCNEWTPDGYFVDASGAWR